MIAAEKGRIGMDFEGVNMISCGNVNCYIIRGMSGDVLIDTGTPDYRDEIEVWLHNYNVKLIVLTHGHNDHIGNAGYFSGLLNAKIAMSAYDVPLAKNNLARKFYAVGIRGKIMEKASVKLMKSMAEYFDTDIFLSDDMTIGEEYGIENCKAIKLDGHTKGSFGILHGKDLYIGDAAMNYTEPLFPALCESPAAARRSLDRVKDISPERIFFGHGAPIEGRGPKYRNMFSKKFL